MGIRLLPAGAALVAAGMFAASTAQAAPAYALTDNNFLLKFDTATPSTITGVGPILNAGNNAIQDLIGIDFRPTNGALYGVGSGGAIYTIDTATAKATQVATLLPDPADASNPFAGLAGTRFGFDFNPEADRLGNPSLRILSNTDYNARVNVDTGWVTTDTSLPSAANLVAGGYTNHDTSASTPTSLLGIDSVSDQLVQFSNPNAGTFSNVGPLGMDMSSLSGFDVFFDGVTNTGFAALQDASNGVSRLYTINLATGAATLVNTIEGGDFVDGLTVQPVPEPAAVSVLGLAALAALSRRRR